MEDQVAKASGLGLKCVYLSQGDRCNDELVQAVLAGEYQIIFVWLLLRCVLGTC